MATPSPQTRCHVLVELSTGQRATLNPGDLVGRLWSAKLSIDDSRVSEAHAMISLRGATLKLLGLRGVLAVKGRRVPDVTLMPGMRVFLARDLYLTVLEVEVPSHTLALRVGDLPPQILSSSVYSLFVNPVPQMRPRHDPSADGWVWSTGKDWSWQAKGGSVQTVTLEEDLKVRGVIFRAEPIPVRQSASDETVGIGQLHPPMHLIARYDSFHIHRSGRDPVVISGIASRILSELVAFGGPTNWETVAREVWRQETDRNQLRRKWDVNLARLRKRLHDHQIRPDLLKSDGKGNLELIVDAGDRVSDET